MKKKLTDDKNPLSHLFQTLFYLPNNNKKANQTNKPVEFSTGFASIYIICVNPEEDVLKMWFLFE